MNCLRGIINYFTKKYIITVISFENGNTLEWDWNKYQYFLNDKCWRYRVTVKINPIKRIDIPLGAKVYDREKGLLTRDTYMNFFVPDNFYQYIIHVPKTLEDLTVYQTYANDYD